MVHDALGTFHLGTALVAIVAGAWVLRNRKATRRHRVWGYVYVLAMLSTNFSALGILRLTGSFNLLHAFAVISLLSIIVGMLAILCRWPAKNGFDLHLACMVWSYIGLIAALVSESATRIGVPLLIAHGYPPRTLFWVLVGLATGIVVAFGALQLRRFKPALERYRPR